MLDRVEPVEKPNRPTGLRRNRPVYDQTGQFIHKPAGLVPETENYLKPPKT